MRSGFSFQGLELLPELRSVSFCHVFCFFLVLLQALRKFCQSSRPDAGAVPARRRAALTNHPGTRASVVLHMCVLLHARKSRRQRSLGSWANGPWLGTEKLFPLAHRVSARYFTAFSRHSAERQYSALNFMGPRI